MKRLAMNRLALVMARIMAVCLCLAAADGSSITIEAGGSIVLESGGGDGGCCERVTQLEEQVARLEVLMQTLSNITFGDGNTPPSSAVVDAVISKANEGTTLTYAATGTAQTLVVPDGVYVFRATLWGAAGGGGRGGTVDSAGGCGGKTTGYIVTSPGTTIEIQVGLEVGQGGSMGPYTNPLTLPARPYPNGGQPALRDFYPAGQGGGRSAIVGADGTYLLVAGAGGGAGGKGCDAGCGGVGTCGASNSDPGTGGNGGGTSGSNGLSSIQCLASDSTHAANVFQGVGGGQSGAYQLQGQDATSGNWQNNQTPDRNAVGGGGDGWYGGAVGGPHAGAGGGSGYVNADTLLVRNGVTESGTSDAKCGVAAGTGADGEVQLVPMVL